MKRDFSHHLLLQIEILRCVISHEELSKRLGGITERSLARYVAGKAHLREGDFKTIAQALSIDPQLLAKAWAASLGLRMSGKDAVSRMLDRAYRHWRRNSCLVARRVPPSPSPMTIIRDRYADRLPRQPPPLWFTSFGNKRNTHQGHERFNRAYKMLVEFVHDRQSQRNVGAMYGISGIRAAQLMRRAAHTWAKSEGIDLIYDKSVPFKNDAKLVKNLYAGCKFFAEQQFALLTAEAEADKCDKKTPGR